MSIRVYYFLHDPSTFVTVQRSASPLPPLSRHSASTATPSGRSHPAPLQRPPPLPMPSPVSRPPLLLPPPLRGLAGVLPPSEHPATAAAAAAAAHPQHTGSQSERHPSLSVRVHAKTNPHSVFGFQRSMHGLQSQTHRRLPPRASLVEFPAPWSQQPRTTSPPPIVVPHLSSNGTKRR